MQLVGHFNVGDTCLFCVKIDGPVTIVGTGDPTVASPRPSQVTIIEGGTLGLATSPFTVNLPANAPAGAVDVSRLWFDKGTLSQILVNSTNTDTSVRFSYLRLTRVTPLAGVASAGILAFPKLGVGPSLRGQIQMDHNFVQPAQALDPTLADINPVAVAFDDFSTIAIVDNTFISSGEAEIEYSGNPDATILYARNNIVSNTVESSLTRLLYQGGAPGYPAAIKVAGVVARQVQVLDNHAVVSGSGSSACMLVTSAQTPEGNLTRTLIRATPAIWPASGLASPAGSRFRGAPSRTRPSSTTRCEEPHSGASPSWTSTPKPDPAYLRLHGRGPRQRLPQQRHVSADHVESGP